MVHTGDTFSVYVLTNTVNGKRYVGCTRVPVMSRWGNGLCYKHNKALNSDIQSHGWGSFTREVVASNLDYDTASSLEVELISKYQANNPECGYNKHTAKGKGLCGYVSKPHDGWNKGMKHSEETKERMRQSHLGTKQSPEWVAKRMANAKGRKPSKEKLAKLIPVLKANSEKKKRPCRTINVSTGEIKEYNSLKEASVATGCTCISQAIKKGIVRKGHRFEYV